MFKIDNKTKQISITRGDVGTIILTNKSGVFDVNDKIKFSIVEKKNFNNVILQKEYTITEQADTFNFSLTSEDTTIGDIINKPVVYWYEIEYNGDQTLIGYDDAGPKEFVLYPEAKEGEE